MNELSNEEIKKTLHLPNEAIMEAKELEKHAVISELQGLCPSLGDKKEFVWGEIRHWVSGLNHYFKFVMNFHGRQFDLGHNSDYFEGGFDEYGMAFVLLGLETRRAVDAERAKAAKLVDFIEKCANNEKTELAKLSYERYGDMEAYCNDGALRAEAAKALAAWKGESV